MKSNCYSEMPCEWIIAIKQRAQKCISRGLYYISDMKQQEEKKENFANTGQVQNRE